MSIVPTVLTLFSLFIPFNCCTLAKPPQWQLYLMKAKMCTHWCVILVFLHRSIVLNVRSCTPFFMHCTVQMWADSRFRDTKCHPDSQFPTNRDTNQCTGPCATADEILTTQTEVVVAIFQHVWHNDTQLLPLWVYVIRQLPGWKRQRSMLVCIVGTSDGHH